MTSAKSSTRDQIVDLIKNRGEMTIKQIREVIGITSMGVRQHVSALEQLNLVQCRMQKQKLGRPVQIFSLTSAAETRYPSGYGPLVLGLLKDLEEMDGPEKVQKLLAKRRQGLAKEYKKLLSEADEDDRFAILAQLRDKDGYMCEATKGDDGRLCIVEHHCPISAVAQEYPEICTYEHQLFEEALDTKLQRHEHIMDGGKCCKFVETE